MNTVVSCKDLSKHYDQGRLQVIALNQINLEILKGEFVCLSGPSGSGKTTLLNLIGGLDQPTTGEISVSGNRIDQMDKTSLADLRLHNIGFIFQAYNLIPVLSARENVEMVMEMIGVNKKERHAKSQEILKVVGLEGMEKRRPAELSGGQQQRVAVARAIVSNPSIILADEPTANLDSQTAENLLELMRKMNDDYQTTFIISTHDPRVMKHSKRLVSLVDGNITQIVDQN